MTTSRACSRRASRPAYDRIEQRARLTRYGCDGYAYCMLAAGHIDIVIESGLKAFDISGLIPIIRAAGGTVTTWTGEPAQGGGRIVAAATAQLHAQALEILNG